MVVGAGGTPATNCSGPLIPEGTTMSEIEYLRERAESCRAAAGTMTLPSAIRQLEDLAAAYERRAAVLEARVASRK